MIELSSWQAKLRHGAGSRVVPRATRMRMEGMNPKSGEPFRRRSPISSVRLPLAVQPAARLDGIDLHPFLRKNGQCIRYAGSGFAVSISVGVASRS